MHVSPLARPLVVAAVASLFVALALSFCSPASGQQISGSVESGRISGAVVDRENGRPVASAQVIIVGLPGGSESDLDGRFRTQVVNVGTYSLRVRRIGYQALRAVG